MASGSQNGSGAFANAAAGTLTDHEKRNLTYEAHALALDLGLSRTNATIVQMFMERQLGLRQDRLSVADKANEKNAIEALTVGKREFQAYRTTHNLYQNGEESRYADQMDFMIVLRRHLEHENAAVNNPAMKRAIKTATPYPGDDVLTKISSFLTKSKFVTPEQKRNTMAYFEARLSGFQPEQALADIVRGYTVSKTQLVSYMKSINRHNDGDEANLPDQKPLTHVVHMVLSNFTYDQSNVRQKAILDRYVQGRLNEPGMPAPAAGTISPLGQNPANPAASQTRQNAFSLKRWFKNLTLGTISLLSDMAVKVPTTLIAMPILGVACGRSNVMLERATNWGEPGFYAGLGVIGVGAMLSTMAVYKLHNMWKNKLLGTAREGFFSIPGTGFSNLISFSARVVLPVTLAAWAAYAPYNLDRTPLTAANTTGVTSWVFGQQASPRIADATDAAGSSVQQPPRRSGPQSGLTAPSTMPRSSIPTPPADNFAQVARPAASALEEFKAAYAGKNNPDLNALIARAETGLSNERSAALTDLALHPAVFEKDKASSMKLLGQAVSQNASNERASTTLAIHGYINGEGGITPNPNEAARHLIISAQFDTNPNGLARTQLQKLLDSGKLDPTYSNMAALTLRSPRGPAPRS